jgi:hypothetical protein
MYKLLFLVLLPIFSLAQSSVRGKIIDKENHPISNVKITINGVESVLFEISSFSSISNIVTAIKGMSNCYNNPIASNPTSGSGITIV